MRPTAFILILLSLQISGSVNMTLVSVSLTNDLRSGYRRTVRVYDIVLQLIRDSDPPRFQNLTHTLLKCCEMSRRARPVASALVSSAAINSEGDDAASCFSRFYFSNRCLFDAPLDEQFTIITTV